MSNITVSDNVYNITIAETTTSVTVSTGDAITVLVDTFTISTGLVNVGDGAEVGKSIDGDSLVLRTLVNTDNNIVITQNANDINIDTAGTITANITGQVSDISNHDTDDLSEGTTNLYYTDARVDTYLKSGGVSSINFGNNTSLTWNDDDGTLEFPVNNEVTLQIGQEELIHVKNVSGAALTNGQVVSVTGASGSKLTVDVSDYTQEGLSSATIAVMTQDLNNNAVGYATTAGLVRGLNTSSFTEGAILWLDENGAFTATKPLTPKHLVQVGWVVRSHATEGSIFVHVKNGWELEELHDVLITSVANGDTVKWNGTGGYWENADVSTLLSDGFNISSATITDLDTANITHSGNIVVTTNTPGNYVNIDTDNLYVGTTTTAVQITPTTITSLSGSLTITADITGDVEGNLTGDVTGDVTGNVVGNLTGDVTGNLIGQHAGNVLASNQTSVVLNAGTDGTDATFTGSVTGTVSSIANHDTGDLTEGTNLYYTDARSRAAISATGSLTYNSTTGEISYTQPTNVSTFTNDAGYLTSYTETDPVFTASAAYGITSTNITNWNTAYGWGDHSAEGYLTSYTETDPVYTASSWYSTTNNSGNWNTAYGWGDHSIVGYLTDLSGQTTDNLTEGTTNVYYNDTYVDNHLTGGTGVTYNNGSISIGQPVGTGDDVSFNSISTNNFLPKNIAYSAKNVGSALSKGDPVYIHSFASQRIQVARVYKNNQYGDNTPIVAWAIAAEDVAQNAVGNFITKGVIENVNTSGIAEGRPIYMTAQSASQPWDDGTGYGDDVQQLGFCVQEDNTNGIIWVEVDNPVSHTSTLQGNIEINGHFLPSANVAHDLGSTTRAWRDIYVGPGSLYVDGQKIVSSDEGTIDITTDAGQNLNIQAGGTTTILSGGGVTNLTDATLNFGPTTNDGTINIKGTLEAPDVHVGDLELSATLLHNTALGQNLEIRTDGYLHANVADVYVGTLTNYTKLDEASIETSADWLTLNNDVDVTGLIKINDGFTLSTFNPYAAFGGTTMSTSVMGVGQQSGWAGMTVRSRGEHDWGLQAYGIPPESPRALLALQGGRLDGSNDDYLNSGDKFAQVIMNPYSGYRTGTEWLTPSALIEATATENHSSSGMGTKLRLWTTENGDFGGATDAQHAKDYIEIQGTTLTSSGTLKIADDLIITGGISNDSGDIVINDKVEINGSNAKETIIGDDTIAGTYAIHGIKVKADDTAWGSVVIQEYVGGADKPFASGFANPSFGTEIIGGTPSSPTNVDSGKRLFLLQALAANQTDGTLPTTANFRIKAETTEAQTTSARGTKLTLETIANGSTGSQETLSLQGNEVTINSGGNGILKTGGDLLLGSRLDTNGNNIVNNSGDVTVDDNLKVNSSLTVDGTANLNGNVNLGNANTDAITATGYLKASNGFGLTVMNTSTANYLSGVLGIISTGDVAYISDGDSGSPCIGVYNGSSWKRIALGSDISSS